MNIKMYEPEQMAFAERVAKAMASVPENKRPVMETAVECLLIGAGVVSSPTAERPSA